MDTPTVTTRVTLRRPRDAQGDTGLSRSGLYREVRAGRLPPPVHLSPGCVAWPSTDIDAWIAARLVERDAQATVRVAEHAAQRSTTTSADASTRGGAA